MNLHQTEQNNSKSIAVANNIENQNNSEQGISLMPPEINFSDLHEQVPELLQFKEDSRKDIPNFLQVWNKNQDITPIQRKQVDKKENSPIQQKTAEDNISNENYGNTNQQENFMIQMQKSFQTDFSDVNIHKNSKTAKNLGALAFTQGNNVHFAPGQFKPDTKQGKELIGHEFAHVVQQRQGKVQPNKQIGKFKINDNSALEKQADEMGKKVANNQFVAINTDETNVSNIIQGVFQEKSNSTAPPIVFITGAEADAAFIELQSSVASELNLSKDPTTGRISYTVINTEKKLSRDAQKLVDAINDLNVEVLIHAEETEVTSTGRTYIGGAFMGNSLVTFETTRLIGKDDRIPSTETKRVANQEINPIILHNIDDYYGSPGSHTLHEVTEAYKGALIANEKKLKNVGPATNTDVNNPESIYYKAHKKATKQKSTINETVYNNLNEEIIAPYSNIPGNKNYPVRVEYSIQKGFIRRRVIMTIP